MVEHVSLKEAAEIFGTSYDTLNRRIGDGLLPEAVKVGSGRGKWLIRTDQLPAIADREHWSLDLRQEPAVVDAQGAHGGAQAVHEAGADTAQAVHQAPDDAVPHALAEAVREALGIDSMLQVERDRTAQLREEGHQLALQAATLAAESSAAATVAASTITSLEAERETTRRRLDQMVSDLEQERAERSRITADLATTKVSLTQTEALLESERASADRDRARLAEAEQRLSAQTAELAAAHQAMGWWGRRRYQRR